MSGVVWHPSAHALRRAHLALLVVWLIMVPVSLITGWIASVVFVGACSIYANAASHWAAWQGSRAEEQVNGDA